VRKRAFAALCTMRFVAAAVLLMIASAQAQANDGRVQLTFVKAAADASGTGVLFYELQRYSLRIEGIDAKAFRGKRVDLVGTASNLQNTADIVGTYTAADAAHASAGHGAVARLENEKGVVLEVRGVNLNRPLSLNGLRLINSGWQIDSE
jgi:hypothetical protein